VNQTEKNLTETPKNFFQDIHLNNYSETYKFAYNFKKIPDQNLAKLSEYNETAFQTILLPGKNRYLPENFSMTLSNRESVFENTVQSDGNFQSANVFKKGKKTIDLTPLILINNNKYLVWHKGDESFALPMYVVHLSFDSSITHQSAKNSLLMLILIEHLKQETLKYLYDALYIGYKIEFSNSGKGLEILIKGYSDKTDLALLEIVKLIKNISFDAKKFDFLQKIALQCLKNNHNEPAYEHGKQILTKILRKYYYTPFELETLVDVIKLEDLIQFLNEYKSKLFIEMLVYGNVNQEITENLAQNLSVLLNFEELQTENLMKEEILNIKDQFYQYRDFNENAEDKNNLLMNYYQYGPYELNSSILLGLINEKMNNDAFNYLRGELQLGYIVASSKVNMFGINAIRLVVQGLVADPLTMDEKAEEFLHIFSDSMLGMSDEEFDSITTSTIKILEEGDKEIEQTAQFLWGEIRCQFYEFDKRRKAINFMKNLKKDDMLHFYKSFISQNIGKLSVQLYSQAKYSFLDNKTLDKAKTYLKMNGTTNIIVQDWEGFNDVSRYQSQSRQDFQNLTIFMR